MAQMSVKPGAAQKLHNLNEIQLGLREQYCRLCLSSTGNQFKQLFSPFNTTQNIVEVIAEFAKVTILQEDEYSKLICPSCFIKLTENQNFKSLIENSDLKLRNQRLKCNNGSFQFASANNNDDDSDHEKVDVDEINVKIEFNSGTDLDKDNDIKEIIDLEKLDKLKMEERSFNVIKPVKLKKILKTVSGKNDKVDNKKKRGRPKGDKKVVGDDNDDDDDVPLIKLKKRRIRKEYHLKCPHCDMVFTRHENRQKHVITHTGIYPFYCSFCNKGLNCKTAFDAHLATHTEERRYQCEICGKGFKRPNALVAHTRSHVSEKPFKCDQCYREFKSKHTLLMHIASIHPSNEKESKFVCEICNKSYPTTFHLKVHSYSHKRQEIYCDLCDKNVKHYKYHLKMHTKPHKCSVCNQGFRSLGKLKEHSAVHTGQRLYECDICKKTYRFHGSLFTHKRTHDLTKRPKCEICDKQFIYKQQLKLHLEKAHPESN